jgi:hypothetical protein
MAGATKPFATAIDIRDMTKWKAERRAILGPKRSNFATNTIYLFRCGDSGLYALTEDSSGSTLPSRIYPQIRWRFERLVTVRTDSNSLKQKIMQAILDSIAKEGFKLIHASVSPELYATLR